LHHAAFDSFIIGISPEYNIIIREDVLIEIDGPMLQHGIQKLNGSKIFLPDRKSDWPNQDALEWKYQRFLKAH
jgi:putative restriction endonuclease